MPGVMLSPSSEDPAGPGGDGNIFVPSVPGCEQRPGGGGELRPLAAQPSRAGRGQGGEQPIGMSNMEVI